MNASMFAVWAYHKITDQWIHEGDFSGESESEAIERCKEAMPGIGSGSYPAIVAKKIIGKTADFYRENWPQERPV